MDCCISASSHTLLGNWNALFLLVEPHLTYHFRFCSRSNNNYYHLSSPCCVSGIRLSALPAEPRGSFNPDNPVLLELSSPLYRGRNWGLGKLNKICRSHCKWLSLLPRPELSTFIACCPFSSLPQRYILPLNTTHFSPPCHVWVSLQYSCSFYDTVW